ncbi:MAG: hypothetical protein ACI9SJ_001224 [Flavobacteriaceae bacterium]|jgi:hypothetical protein|uniref:LETM1-related biofilm-associated protein n=1 Tax=Candidatus Marifrigoribacter sp. Uisw_064 TaxID=3230970 RepID=UPI003AE63064
MNPSAPGWILKFYNQFEKHQLIDKYLDDNSFYNHLKSTGFIFGVSITALPDQPISNLKITKDEFTKINLFHTLLYTYFKKYTGSDIHEAVKNIAVFYSILEKGKTGFLTKLTLSQTPESNLEHVLSARLNETNSEIEKKSTTALTYAMLYIDILTYRYYLNTSNVNAYDLKRYSEELESSLINCSFLALKSKKDKNKNDHQLIELYDSSTDYLIGEDHLKYIHSIKSQTYLSKYDTLEKRFILDICCLAVWDDKIFDESEIQFLKQLTQVLKFSDIDLSDSIQSLKYFSKSNATKIKLFEYSSPITQLYKQSTATVKLLILRNKNRLIKELNESGELLVLLSQSTLRDLNADEKSKVKEQLLDICKSVPSLTIFLVPGGSLLLPLLVKYIPSLLPSAFQENKIKKKDL